MSSVADENDDPTRACARCAARPRWSRHGNCRNCVECSGKKVRYCIMRRKKDEPTRTLAERRLAKAESNLRQKLRACL